MCFLWPLENPSSEKGNPGAPAQMGACEERGKGGGSTCPLPSWSRLDKAVLAGAGPPGSPGARDNPVVPTQHIPLEMGVAQRLGHLILTTRQP